MRNKKDPPAWLEYTLAAMLIVLIWALAMSVLFYSRETAHRTPQESETASGGVSVSPTQTESAEPTQMPEEADEQVLITAALVQKGYFREDVPLDFDLQDALHAICDNAGVPYELALGLIQLESGFQVDARNGICYGLCQLNERYFPAGLDPVGNMEAGIGWLGELLQTHSVTEALDIYHNGHVTGETAYPAAVLAYAKGCGYEKSPLP